MDAKFSFIFSLNKSKLIIRLTSDIIIIVTINTNTKVCLLL